MPDAREQLDLASGKSKRRLQTALAGLTLAYWLFAPTGMLLPMLLGFELRYYSLGLFFGLCLLIATAATYRESFIDLGMPKPAHLLVLGIFVAFLAISAIDPINSRSEIYASYAFYLLAAMGGISLFLIARAIGYQAVDLMIGCFCASFLIYLVFFLTNTDAMLGRAKGDWAFAFWPFGNIRTVAIYFMPGIVGAAVLASSKAHDAKRNFFLCTAIIGMAFFFWIGSRGPIMAATLSLAMVAILIPKADRLRFFYSTLIILTTASLLSLCLPRMNASYGFWQRLFEMLYAENPDVLSARGSVWLYTLEKILIRPWTGYGFGSYLSHADVQIEWRRHAHNDILQLWHDFGLIGGSAGLWIIILTVTRSVKRTTDDIRAFACIAVTSSLVLVSMIDTVVAYAGNFVILCLALGLCAGVAIRRPGV